MIGFALEGGGAKGAYQAGAYVALVKNGIKPDYIAGTSIGSLNAALMAQGDIDKLIKLWLNATTDIFGINSDIIEKIKHKRFTKNDLKPTYNNIRQIIKNRGIDTTDYYNIINESIDENKLRSSKTKFGLVTIKLDGKPIPVEIMIDDIPKGKVAEYILASCYLPVFKFKPIIDNNYYLDGGFYNNVPLDILEKQGCDTIYSIRIKGVGRSHNKLKKETKVIEIKPKKSLGRVIIFDKESNEYNMHLGYYDTLRVIKHLDGIDYYFKSKSDNYYERIVRNINGKTLKTLMSKYHVKTNKDLVLEIVESILKENKVDEFNIYNLKLVLLQIKRKYYIKDKTIKSFINNCKIFL